jgi:hypothetical protein
MRNSPSILITAGVRAHELLRIEQRKAWPPAYDQLTFLVGASHKFMASSRTTLPGFAGLAAAAGLMQLG